MWAISDHACRVCLGRVLVGRFAAGRDGAPDFTRPAPDGIAVARCAQCGNVGLGGPESVCCCGHAYPKGVRSGLRCRRADDVVLGRSEIVVEWLPS